MFVFKTVKIIDGAGQVRETLKDYLLISLSIEDRNGRLTVKQHIFGLNIQEFYLGEHERLHIEIHWRTIILTTTGFIVLFSLMYWITVY